MVIQGATRWAHDVNHAIAPTRVRYYKADDDAGHHDLSAIGPKQTFCACGLVSASTVARCPPWVLTKEEGMNDDRTKADKAWEARQEAARYGIFNAATNAAEASDEADDEKYFAVLDQAGNAAEAAAAEITGYKAYADLLEALDTRRKQS